MANGILIVDDATFMRMMIKDVLVKNGFKIAGEA
ncbi:MAG: two-component system response regulator, partial [Clostridiales bacterium]|nr:two-component system response regulator [Clostridiales bacterium]